MAIAEGALIEISNVGNVSGQQVRNVWQYEVTSGLPSVTAVDIATAWWNHVKATFRALIPTTFTTAFETVEMRELNAPTGLLGAYGIPPTEQAGTRSPGAESTSMPFFNAVSIRLNVGTRATRPGQKRICCLVETDNNAGILLNSARTPAEALGALMVQSMTFGAPAALMVVRPIVTRKDSLGNVTAFQGIQDATVATYISSQNSRKIGRGA